MKRTKIVATLGPASEDKKVLSQMIRAGLDVARLNFSHGNHSNHRTLIKNVRRLSTKLDRPLAVLQDLQGPRIRIGELPKAGVKVVKGQTVVFFYSLGKAKQVKKVKSAEIEIPIHYRFLHRDLEKGAKILIDDGLIELSVEKISKAKIYAKVETAGSIKTHKGMNFPGSKIKANPLTGKDLADLEFGIKNKVDFVAISFVKSGAEIKKLKKKIYKLEKKYNKLKGKKIQTKVIAKIERHEAVKNFNVILKHSDGIMVARGDLGIELPFEDVPLIQKDIIFKCALAGKPVIVATQMLDSMIRNPRPTRAEVSDVANAILDGTDGIMLSGESATGLYPIEAVRAMNRIAKEIEPKEFELQQGLEAKLKRLNSLSDFSAYNSQDLAEKLKAKLIICLSIDGELVKKIVRYKSKVPVFAFVGSEQVRNQLSLSWGVSAFKINFSSSAETSVNTAISLLKKKKIVKLGNKVVVCVDRHPAFWRLKDYIKVEDI